MIRKASRYTEDNPKLCRAEVDTIGNIKFDSAKSEGHTLQEIIEDDKKYGTFKPLNGKYFTYKVLDEDDEMTNKEVLKSIQYSYRRISLRTNLVFRKVGKDKKSDFTLDFRTVETDPDNELRPSTLMYHYYPISNINNRLRGLCVINKAFYWTSHGNPLPLNVIDPKNYPNETKNTGKTYDFDQVYTHEVLHGLGLPHSPNAWNVMSWNYGIMSEWLTAEDIARINAKYPERQISEGHLKRWLNWLFHASDR